MRKNIFKRIIINIRDEDISSPVALECVNKVIQMGRISNENTQYCYATSFVTGKDTREIMVSTDITEHKTDIFHVFYYGDE